MRGEFGLSAQPVNPIFAPRAFAGEPLLQHSDKRRYRAAR